MRKFLFVAIILVAAPCAAGLIDKLRFDFPESWEECGNGYRESQYETWLYVQHRYESRIKELEQRVERLEKDKQE